MSLKFLKNNFCTIVLKEGDFMNKITKLMIQNPFISMLLIFPFSLAVVIGLFSIILDIILPFVMAGFMTYLAYNYIVGKSNNETFKNKSQMSILFSNDNNRYPVKIWLNMKYGSLVLELESITN